MSAAAIEDRWLASLELYFERRRQATILAKRRHFGPLAIQKTFHPGDGTCHGYLLHPPGGVVGGDHLSVSVAAGEGARALITTPAAGKFYRSAGRDGVLEQSIKVAAGASCEWLPQETILFSGARARMSTRIQLTDDARFVGWEILCLGRPAADEAFNAGLCRQAFEIERNGMPLFMDRCRWQGGSSLLSARWGLNGYEVLGTLVATPADSTALARAQALCHLTDAGLAAATLMGDVLVCRYLAPQAHSVLKLFQRLWAELRPGVIGVDASAPRIWAT